MKGQKQKLQNITKNKIIKPNYNNFFILYEKQHMQKQIPTQNSNEKKAKSRNNANMNYFS